MALVINTNLGSINGQRNLNSSAASLSTSMQRLSSGVRVNSAKDDAAGLAIADRMSSQVRGMTVAVRNANDGVSLTQTAEGALGSLTDTLQRMRDLAVQSSSNAGVSASDRAKMDTEFKALNDELMRVVQNSEFNGKKILNGDLAGGLNIQVGATTDTNSRISVNVSNMGLLLTPVTKATLSPANQIIDSTLSATVSSQAVAAGSNPILKSANDAAGLANKAVVAAQKAAAAPTDVALAKAAAEANKLAAKAIADSSTTTLNSTTANRTSNLVSQAFTDTVTAADAKNQTTTTQVSSVVVGGTTDSNQAASLLTTATQLAASATANVSASGQNLYVQVMNKLTGDAIDTPAAAKNSSGLLTASTATLDLKTLTITAAAAAAAAATATTATTAAAAAATTATTATTAAAAAAATAATATNDASGNALIAAANAAATASAAAPTDAALAQAAATANAAVSADPAASALSTAKISADVAAKAAADAAAKAAADAATKATADAAATSATYTLNDAVNRAYKEGNAFGADREAQKTLAGLAIAKAISGASFVEDPLKTAMSNQTDKSSFINNNKLVTDVSTAADAVAADYALAAINNIDAAIAAIDTERSNLGSTQNRFTTTISNLQSGIENQSAARSRIMDADFATETANLSRSQILQQAGTAMLAQANQSGQSVMTLLR